MKAHWKGLRMRLVFAPSKGSHRRTSLAPEEVVLANSQDHSEDLESGSNYDGRARVGRRSRLLDQEGEHLMSMISMGSC